jgi:hypothetical protein
MASLFGGVLLDAGSVEEPDAATVRLVGPAGDPLTMDPVAIEQRLEQMVTTTGEPLFPHANSAAVAEDEAYLAWQRTAMWRAMEPGPELAYELSGEPLEALPSGGVVELAQAHARLIAHHEALLADSLAELASRPEYQQCAGPHEHDSVKAAASEVSLALSWTPAYADARVRDAVALVRELPSTLAALREGRIDSYLARVITSETASLADDPEARAEVEQGALRVAEGKTGPALRTHVKRSVLRRAPEQAEKRRRQARRARRVDKPFPETDGMASMQLYGPIEDLAALFTAVDAAARARRDAATRTVSTGSPGQPDADTPLEALRFDALADAARAALNAGHLGCCAPGCSGSAQRLGSRQGRAATINVTVPFTTLIGIDDEPGVLTGYGLIHPEVARRIAADATWRRILTDPVTGAVLDFGTTRYTPPRHLADHVMARDVTCRFPTCNWTAEACQLDHTIAHRPDGTGGSTSAANLGPLHDRHHMDKTHHGFAFVQPGPGRFVITTPAGLTYHVEPEVVGPLIDRPPDEAGADPPPDESNPDESSPGEPPF